MIRATGGERPRVMLYSQDGFGLGHLRRTSSIAAALAEARPDAAVLTVADSPLGQFFGTVPQQDYVKLPSIVKLAPGDWRPVGLPLRFAQVHAMRRDLLRATALSFRPHLLLVDHMPHGAMGELRSTLKALRRSDVGTRIVLGLRDILDAPEVVRRRWALEAAYDALERYYDLVLVYGRQEVFDLAEQYGFPPTVAERLRYTGYVCAPGQGGDAAAVRAERTSGAGPGHALVVAMAGGGADGYPMLRAVLDALPAVRAEHACVAALVAGPFLPEPFLGELRERAGPHATVLESVRDPLSYMRAADVVASMAGYSTTVEVLRSGTPAVVIPRPGPSAEQRTRAGLFADRGWVRTVDPAHLSGESVASALLDSLGRGASGAVAPPPERPPVDGLGVAVGHLLALLDGGAAAQAPGPLLPVAGVSPTT
jgi:predicted glycosyltransferase